MNGNSNKTLVEALGEYKKFIAAGETTYAILYTPSKCYLALVDASGNFEVQDNADTFSVDDIFEARIFNTHAELRWLKGYGAAIITEETFKSDKDFVGTNPHSYLLWGQSMGKHSDDGKWTQFGEARIGAFFVPVPKVAEKGNAQITAVEYLKKYEDGNVAMVDERLLRIEAVQTKAETQGNG